MKWRVGDHVLCPKEKRDFTISKIRDDGFIYGQDTRYPYGEDELELDPSVYDEAKREDVLGNTIKCMDSGPGLKARTDLRKPPPPERRRKTGSWSPDDPFDLLS